MPMPPNRQYIGIFLGHIWLLFLGTFLKMSSIFHSSQVNHNNRFVLLCSWLYSMSKFQWFFGFIVFFYPGMAPSVRGEVLPWHALSGLFIYGLVVTSTELGFLEKLTFLEKSGLNKYGPEAFLVNFIGLIVLLLGGSVVLSVFAPAHSHENSFSYKAISNDLA